MASRKEIAAEVRNKLKKAFPDCEVSVTLGKGSSRKILVTLMSAPFDVWGRGSDIRDIKNGYRSVNHFYINNEPITKKAMEFFNTALMFLKEYHYDHSNPQIDEFNTNFYIDFSIGRYDKPFRLSKGSIAKPTKIEHKTFKGRKRRSVAEAIMEG